MKWFLFATTIICIAACNHDSKKETKAANTTAGGPAYQPLKNEVSKNDNTTVDPEPWKISSEVAGRMKLFLNGCKIGCKNKSIIIDYNKPVYDAIKEKYPSSKIVEVAARYDKDDIFRYCALRKLYNKPEFCDVTKYKTMIYMVAKDETNNLTEDLYYDIVSICPPPRECDRTDSLHNQ